MTAGAQNGRERIKILFVLTSSAGGAGAQAYQLAREIPRDEFELSVAFGPGYPLDEDFRALDVPVRTLSLSRKINPFVNLRGLVEIYRLSRRERFDVVCTSCSIAGFCGRIAAWLARVPARVHVIQVYASRPYQAWWRRAFYRWIERGLDLLTTRYVAVSEAVKRYGVDTGIMAAEKVDVIFNAAELTRATPAAALAVRRELDLAPDAPVIGTLGRYEEQKGLPHFLRAAARIHAARPDTRFLVVGDGPQRDSLEALARDLGIAHAVRFTGWRRDVPEILGALDVFCLASLWETFGIVLAEAMLAELPIVASRVDGIPEVVADGETGWLVPPRDDEELASRLLALLEDSDAARAMGQAGRRRAETLFSVDAMVAGYGELFRGLAARSR